MIAVQNLFDVRIDGDTLVYRAGFAADSKDGVDASHSLYNLKLIMGKILDKLSPCNYKVYLSNEKKDVNFRYAVDKTYKQNRKLASKPKYYEELRNHLIKYYDAIVVEWGEADDYLGIDYNINTIIVSNDKDLLMIPCGHYRLSRDELIWADDIGEVHFKVTGKVKKLEGTGFKWFCAQMMLGDRVDNIRKPKLGDGDVFIHKLLEPLDNIDSLWRQVEFYYTMTGCWEMLITNAKLLWIARRNREEFTLELIEEIKSNVSSGEDQGFEF